MSNNYVYNREYTEAHVLGHMLGYSDLKHQIATSFTGNNWNQDPSTTRLDLKLKIFPTQFGDSISCCLG